MFIEEIKGLQKRSQSVAEGCAGNEEATKMGMIAPALHALGYNVFNPNEVMPEYTADFGSRKGEAVDYAILSGDAEPLIVVECKAFGVALGEKETNQLGRYYAAVHPKVGILTNGAEWVFYMDIDQRNIMDETPFLRYNLLEDEPERIAHDAAMFKKDRFDPEGIADVAKAMKYVRAIKETIQADMNNPTDDYLRYLAGVVIGHRRGNAIETLRPLVKRASGEMITDLVNKRLQNAMMLDEPKVEAEEEAPPPSPASDVFTTEEELRGLEIVREILRAKARTPKRSSTRTTKPNSTFTSAACGTPSSACTSTTTSSACPSGRRTAKASR